VKKPLSWVLVACVASAVSTAPAGPLKRADVSANPVWLLHLDFDALRQTYIGRYILFQLDKPEFHTNMVAFQTIFSFDPRTQIHGITIYSDHPATKDNVILTYMDFDPDHLIAVAKACEAPQTATNNQHVIYSWADKKNNPNADDSRNYAVFESDLVIKGYNQASVIASLAVIDGSAPNFSGCTGWPDAAAGGDATFVQATARSLDFLDSKPNMALLKMCRGAQLQAYETNEIFHAVLTVKADEEYTAKQMSAVARGLIALLSLQRDNPRAAKLAAGMTVKQDGTTVGVHISIPSKELMAVLKAYTAKKQKEKAGTE
jgi:hypothetical protein